MGWQLIIFLVFAANAAVADPFAASGRLEKVDGQGTCSAALIQPNVVATAAHCIGDEDAVRFAFRLGAQHATAPIPVARVVRHPFYDDFSGQRLRRLRFDIALAELAYPVPAAVAEPFALGQDAEIGEGLFLVSWRGGTGSRPRQRRCLVIEGELPGVVTLGCRVQGGESGAPVLRLVPDGIELVAIVSSRARQRQQPVAIASDVSLRIPALLHRLDGTP